VVALHGTLADDIAFKSGQKLQGEVILFLDGIVTIRKSDGTVIRGDISKIESIDFDRLSSSSKSPSSSEKAKPSGLEAIKSKAVAGTSSTDSSEIQRQIDARVENVQKSPNPSGEPRAIVALYVDTEVPREGLPQGHVEYRCYIWDGWSGSERIPLRQGWARAELVSAANGVRRIQLDPGPPYETFSREVSLKEGEVANLGRIVLKKVKAEGTATISGIVKDVTGNPLPNATVSAGKRKAKADSTGKYQITGVGLEVVSLAPSKGGYFGANRTISIRNMDNRNITQDLVMHQPQRLSMRFAISGINSDSVAGGNVREGTFGIVVDKPRVNLWEQDYVLEPFTTFVKEAWLGLEFDDDGLKLRNISGPIFYQVAEKGADFRLITTVGDIRDQFCPPLKPGSVILIRGFKQGAAKGVSNYCVKILIEELASQ
jgi:hypothetical protein